MADDASTGRAQTRLVAHAIADEVSQLCPLWGGELVAVLIELQFLVIALKTSEI